MKKRVKHVNLALKEDVHTKAKVTAILKGQTLSEFLEEAIEKMLEKEGKVIEKLK